MIGAEWISAGTSVIAIVLSSIAFFKARKSDSQSRSLEFKNAQLAELQTKLAHQSWVDEYFRELTVWAAEIADQISQAIHYLDVDDDKARRDILARLSSRIDTGRWYFPNSLEKGYGDEKEPAYRGFRQPLLDWVILAYDIFAGNRVFSDPRGMLLTCQRQFVSAVQEHIDPRSRKDAILKVLSDFGPVGSLPKIESPAKE
ncbi:hypothetical protein [Pontixanthobacter sp.]|uniref:hypothetical protein n=1 Tax=Pontixanthobacter sp. TaxID=2792078 RepID=UPI003C7A5A3E